MKVAFVTGSREWTDPEPIMSALQGCDALIAGDAPGADRIAGTIACASDIICLGGAGGFRADWDNLGKSAGPRRNREMVERALLERANGMDVCCYAFPIDENKFRGTWDCVRQLEAKGFDVCVVLPKQ